MSKYDIIEGFFNIVGLLTFPTMVIALMIGTHTSVLVVFGCILWDLATHLVNEFIETIEYKHIYDDIQKKYGRR